MITKFDDDKIEEIQARIVIMLYNKRKFNGAHTETINLRRCVERHLRGEKIVDIAIKDLFEREILVNKKSTREFHCSLNNAKLDEIIYIISMFQD